MLRPPKQLPPEKFLKECFLYDHATGVLSWRERPSHHFATYKAWRTWNGRYAGSSISYTSANGYVKVMIGDGNLCSAHRVIWKLMTGKDPAQEIDHRDGDRTNNRWNNLRLANHAQQQMNRASIARDLPKGVRRQKDSATFTARITINGKEIYLGAFQTPEETHAAYCAAREKHFGTFHYAR